MRVSGLDTVAVVDEHPIAVGTEIASENDSAACCGANRSAAASGNVGAIVERANTGDRPAGARAEMAAIAARKADSASFARAPSARFATFA